MEIEFTKQKEIDANEKILLMAPKFDMNSFMSGALVGVLLLVGLAYVHQKYVLKLDVRLSDILIRRNN